MGGRPNNTIGQLLTQTLVEETLVIITIVNKRTIAVKIIEEKVEEAVEEEVGLRISWVCFYRGNVPEIRFI